MSLRILFSALICLLMGLNQTINALEDAKFHSTIPVVDMNDFYNPETKQKFVEQVSYALHHVGFFGVVNPGIDMDALDLAYQASQNFFSNPLESKNEIYAPSLNGQRGYVPSEIAQGHKNKDFKEFLHVGRSDNLWPSWMDLQTPMETLMAALDKHSVALQQAFALAIGEDENFFVQMTQHGECLLRALHYPKNPAQGTFWAAKHTDIDLYTILPMATEEGLQVLHNGEWIDVKVPPNAFIVNGGDMLQNLTNGYFKSATHQVVSKGPSERYSIVYFIHPRSSDSMDPRPQCIDMTGGIQHYPQATRLELLACRLRELGLASPELLQFEKDSHIMDRIKDLVEAGTAAEPVRLTYDIWLKGQKK